ncbi:hypothetical protein VTO73DRAFT_12112 [Trametes versicolor]
MSVEDQHLSDSDSDSDSLPDISQLIEERLTQPKSSVSRHSTPESAQDAGDDPMPEDDTRANLREEVKDEDEDEDQLPDTPASRASNKGPIVVSSSSPAGASGSKRHMKAPPAPIPNSRLNLKTASSSRLSSAAATPTPARTSPPKTRQSARSATKKRAREFEESSSELPRVPASQPLPQPTKRARRAQPPSASQPIPVTPSYKTPTVVKTEPASAAKPKGKQKTVARKRSENFWHLDGSVVVQVQNTLFRLHRSRLTQQSEYFAALQNGDGSRDSPALVDWDLVDSCPVYIVKGVSVLDFERLLTALDAGIAYAINPPPFRVLASLIRASHALSFKTILTFATHLLRDMWPSDLARIHETSHADRAQRVSQATETVLLAQQCDLPELLKAAYHELLRAPDFGQDLAVYVHAESADGADTRRLEMEYDEDEDNAPPARLAASALLRLVAAKEAMQKEWLAHARAPPLPSAFPCPLARLPDTNDDPRTVDAMRKCASARTDAERGWLSLLLQTGVFEAGLGDVFVGLQRLADMDWKEMGYCMGCVSERRDAWLEKREKLWRRLDVLLGLKGEDAR